MVAYTYQMPSGIPGAITRPEQSTVEAQVIDTGTPPTLFGIPVKFVSGKIQPISGGETASDVIGVLARPYPTTGDGVSGLGTTSPTDATLGTATPNPKLPADVLKRGYISVQVGGTTAPSKNSAVYVRIATASAGKPIGGFEAAADSTNTIQLTNAFFTGGMDSGNIAEIAYNI